MRIQKTLEEPVARVPHFNAARRGMEPQCLNLFRAFALIAFICLMISLPLVAEEHVPRREQSETAHALPEALSAAVASLIANGRYDDLYRLRFGASPGSDAHPYPPCPQVPFPRPDDELQAILDSGRVRIGFALLGPPYSEHRDGELDGWDLDLAAAITEMFAAAYTKELTVEHVRLPGSPFPDALFDALDAGKSDAILSDLAITEERRQRVGFSCPYLMVTFGLLSRCESADDLRRVADADRPEVKIVVLRRAFLHRLAEEYLPSATKVFVDDPLDIPRALLDGTAQSALLPTPSLESYAKSHPGELCTGEFQIGPGATRGIAVRKSQP